MLKYSPLAITFEALGWIILMAILYLAINMYPAVPESFPLDFGSGGEPLRYVPRSTAWFHPIMGVLLYVIISGGCLAARKAATPDVPCPRMAAVLNCICLCKSMYLLYELGVTWSNMSLRPVPQWLMPLTIGLGVLVTGAYCVRIIGLSKERKKTNE